MLRKNVPFYEAYIVFGLTALLPALLLPGYALISWLSWTSPERQPSLMAIASIFERLLPLTGGLIAAHLMSVEREEGFDDLRRSYPEQSWRLPLLRWLGALGVALIAAVAAAGIFRLIYGDSFALATILLPALPPLLYLLGFSLLVNNISGNYWAAAAIVVGYFFFDYFTLGEYTGVLYLFQVSMPNPAVDYDLNRLLLAFAGFGFLWGNILYSQWRRTRGG